MKHSLWKQGTFQAKLFWISDAGRETSMDFSGIKAFLFHTAEFPQAEFIALDIDEDTFHRRFDVIIGIGVFNLRIAGIEESMKGLLKNLFPLCRESLHINFLTYYVPRRSVELFYVRPEEIVEFIITEISRTVTVRHMKEDIFLSVYK
jgi:hypothetical protein